MRQDRKAESDKDEEGFKHLIFAHSIVNGNRDLFYKLYPEYAEQQAARAADEWEIPSSVEELHARMAEFQVGAVR